MNPVINIISIVKKDFRCLFALTLLTIGLLITEIIITDLKILELHSPLIQTLIPWLSFLACAILVITTFQLDPAASLTHDWLTRPIPKRDLIFAKLLFLVLFIVVPLFLARFIIDLINGYSLVESLGEASAIDNSFKLLVFPLLMCVSVLSRSLLQTVGILIGLVIGLAIVATLIPFIPNSEGVGSEATYSATIWIVAIPLSLIMLLTFVTLCWLQYHKRLFRSAGFVFTGACVLATAIIFTPFAAPSWSMLFSIQKLVVDSSKVSIGDTLKLDFDNACFPASKVGRFTASTPDISLQVDDRDTAKQLIGVRAWTDEQLLRAGPEAIAFSTTIRGRGMPIDERYIVLKATASYSSDKSEKVFTLEPSPQPAGNRIDPFNNTATHYWLAPAELTKTLTIGPPTELTLDYYLSILSPTTYELEMDNVRRYLPQLGYCSAKKDSFNNNVEVNCFKRGAQPALVSAELIGIDASRVDATLPTYTPNWLQVLSGQHYKMFVASPTLAKSSKILLSAYEPSAFIHKQKSAAGLLGGPVTTCPLPGEEHYAQSSWSDTSTHDSRFITVDQGVRLEVLDWGGPTGNTKTLVLLAGAGATAHSYDNIAPLLAKKYHVIGITRRGFGASSKPDYGYDIDRLSKDIVQIIDTFEIESPIVVGHSFGGDELSVLGADYPDRIAALIYLDAAYDRSKPSTEEATLIRSLPARPRPTLLELTSYQSIMNYLDRNQFEQVPEGEFMASLDMTTGYRKLDPRLGDALLAGVKRPEYEKIKAPALAIYAVPSSAKQLWKPWYDKNEPGLRENIEAMFELRSNFQHAEIENFKKNVYNSKVIVLKDADHSVFMSNPEDVLSAIDDFINNIKANTLKD